MTKDEAIRILKNAAWLGSNDEREATEEAVDMAVDALSADRPKGHWVWNPDGMDWNIGAWVCSECRRKPETWWECDERHNPLNCAGSHFCGNCGADMRGESDERKQMGI